MSNNPVDDRPRKKGPSRGGSRRQGQRRNGAGEGQSQPRPPRHAQPQHHNQSRGGRLSREEIEWARDLWQHGEPVDEIANQLGIEESRVEELIAGWTK